MPKFRRTIEKKWKRKFGHPEYVWKLHVPKTNIAVCSDCGHNFERGHLCGMNYEYLFNYILIIIRLISFSDTF